ncbi:MAG: hypothetical protein WBE58_21175 [Verrucomicrobiales bacterium]
MRPAPFPLGQEEAFLDKFLEPLTVLGLPLMSFMVWLRVSLS